MILFPPGAVASEPWLSSPEGNALAFGTLRPQPSEAWSTPAGEWSVVASTVYFNDWSGSWHPRTIHRELGRDHQPLLSEELRLLEERGPTDHMHFIDVEGWRQDATVTRGFEWGTLSCHFALITLGSPRWDAIGERSHQILHEAHLRELFPRGQTVVYVRTPEHRLELREEINGHYFGNTTLSAGLPLRNLRGRQSIVLSMELPTAERGTIDHTAGWEAGLQWFTQGEWEKSQTLLGAGVTRGSPDRALYGFPRSTRWHALAEWTRSASSRISLVGAARMDTSPIASAFSGEPGKPDVSLSFGIATAVGKDRWITWSLGENVPILGLGADWTFQMQVMVRGLAAASARRP